MISFENDYSEGAHEEILRRLAEVNKEGITGYGNDSYCESAKEKIRQACKCPEADIYFLAGGTQTNQTVIDSVLQSYEGVIAAETGHVASHEAGAIEASGHKVLTLPQQEGKIQPKDVADCLNQFYSDGNHEHMVFPGDGFTSLTQQSMAHCIHAENSQSFLISVSSTIFLCILMEHVLDMVLQ